MRKLTAAVAALLTGCGLVFGQGQGFENYNYTTTPAASTASSSTEKKFSTYLALGAGFSRGGEYVGKSATIYQPQNRYTDADDQYLNLGHGFKIDVGASYRFLEHVDALLGFNISLGTPRVEVKTSTVTAASTVTDDDLYHNAQFGLKLMVIPRFTVFSLIDVYVGGGIGLYWTSFSLESETSTKIGATTTSVKTSTDFGTKATVPFIGVIGAEYPLTNRFILFLDMTYEAMNVTVDQAKVTSGSTTVTTKYKKDSNDANFEDKIPASNLAIRLGLRVPLF
jgi:opacity protein-like surface antigen